MEGHRHYHGFGVSGFGEDGRGPYKSVRRRRSKGGWGEEVGTCSWDVTVSVGD